MIQKIKKNNVAALNDINLIRISHQTKQIIIAFYSVYRSIKMTDDRTGDELSEKWMFILLFCVCKNNIFKNGSTVSCTWYYCSASSQFTSQLKQALVSNWLKFMYYAPMNNVFTSSHIVLFFVHLCRIHKVYILICINVIVIVSFVLVVIFEAENGDTMCEHKMSLTNHTKLVPTD